MRRRTIVAGGVAAVVVAVPLAAYGFLALTSADAPERASLDAAPEAAAGGGGRLDGTWTVATVDTNFVGYRVRERLGPVAAPADAVGRTRSVEGALTFDGDRVTGLDLTVDMTTIASDSTGRDERVRDQVLEVSEFPTGEFHLGEPVEVDAPERGEEVELSIPGDLTLRDRTHPATFDVQARWNGPTLQAAGSTEVERSAYGIGVSGLAGFDVEETVTIEFELTFAPQDATVATPPPTLVDNPQAFTDEEPTICTADGAVPEPSAPILVSAMDGDQPVVEVVRGADRRTPLVTVTGLTGGVSWSADGSEVVYSASDLPEAPRTLARVPAGGGDRAAIAGLRDVLQPDVGPDGRIVFVQRTDDDTSDIWVAADDGTGARRLVATPGEDRDPRWSPDGRSVVFTTVDGADNQNVVLVDVAGGPEPSLRTLAGGPGYEFAPSFADGGRTVLFSRDGAIHSVAIDGSDERRITDSDQDVNPEMSPDGSQLAFLRDGSLYLASPTGTSPRCLPTGHPLTGGPRWQPHP